MSQHPVSPQSRQRITALCYIRNSWTRTEKDLNRADLQRVNILAVCRENGWTPEWYEDVDGHRSAMHEANRPGWLALKKRIGDPDVIALVTNDLSRLHRSSERIRDLLEQLQRCRVQLVLADPNREIDLSTAEGRKLAELRAAFDEWYTVDVSERRKASIAYRKSKGITAGLPPFGTVRNKKTGYLEPTREGAWLLPDGTWQAGEIGETPATDGAIWRGYFDCAVQILLLAAEGSGRQTICRQLQDEGWAYRNRQGQPSPLDVDAIRRVVANWPEYGGYVSGKRARERDPIDLPPDEIIARLDPERSLMDIDLLARVARNRYERAISKRRPEGDHQQNRLYPFAAVIYCAHCEKLAEEQNRPELRTMLAGRLGKYYRHRPGSYCGCIIQSVRCDMYEAQFLQLAERLAIRPEAQHRRDQLLNQADSESNDFETVRSEAIALCNRRIAAAIDLYGEGHINRDEYRRRIEGNQREIAEWQARLSDGQFISKVTRYAQVLEGLTQRWHKLSGEEKQESVTSIFSAVVFDLNAQKIVGCSLDGEASEFLELKVW